MLWKRKQKRKDNENESCLKKIENVNFFVISKLIPLKTVKYYFRSDLSIITKKIFKQNHFQNTTTQFNFEYIIMFTNISSVHEKKSLKKLINKTEKKKKKPKLNYLEKALVYWNFSWRKHVCKVHHHHHHWHQHSCSASLSWTIPPAIPSQSLAQIHLLLNFPHNSEPSPNLQT